MNWKWGFIELMLSHSFARISLVYENMKIWNYFGYANNTTDLIYAVLMLDGQLWLWLCHKCCCRHQIQTRIRVHATTEFALPNGRNTIAVAALMMMMMMLSMPLCTYRCVYLWRCHSLSIFHFVSISEYRLSTTTTQISSNQTNHFAR